MSKLRETTKRLFIEALDKSYFTAANYKITFPDDGDTAVVIEFIPDGNFHFQVGEYGYEFNTIEAPGTHLLAAETFKRGDILECVSAVESWAERILEEYRLRNPVLDAFESFQKGLNEKLQAHINDEEKHFSKAEASALKSKLDELASKLEALLERTSDFEEKLSVARAEIDKLKGDADELPRGVWYRKAGSKVMSMIKGVITSKEGRQFALEAAEKLLLGGPK